MQRSGGVAVRAVSLQAQGEGPSGRVLALGEDWAEARSRASEGGKYADELSRSGCRSGGGGEERHAR